jgi:hypothetical protein
LMEDAKQCIMQDTLDSPALFFGFLSVFHIIGAAVLASALRGFWDGLREGRTRGCQTVFLTVWAVMFGGLPFLFGVQFARSEEGTALFVWGETFVWTAAFLVTLLAQQPLRRALEAFLSQDILLMLFGGGFLLAGVSVMSFLTPVDRRAGLLTGGIFAVLGAGIFGFSLWRLLKSTR